MVAKSIGDYVNPSIGPIGDIAFDEHNNRIRLFSPGISTPSEILESWQLARNAMQEYGASRSIARYISTEPLQMDDVEACIPLQGNFDGRYLLSLGWNDPDRRDGREIRSQETNMLEEIQRRVVSPARILPANYQVELLSNPSDRDVEMLVDLYDQTFTSYSTSLDEAGIRGMVENSATYIVREDGGLIVSSVVGEITPIPMSEGSFILCEMSEMATLEAYEGRGFATAAARVLVSELADQVDLLFGEARATHRGVNQVLHNMGFTYLGRLEQQCQIASRREIETMSLYESLNLWGLL